MTFKILTNGKITWKGDSFAAAVDQVRAAAHTDETAWIELRSGSNAWARWRRENGSWKRIVTPRGQENLAVYRIEI